MVVFGLLLFISGFFVFNLLNNNYIKKTIPNILAFSFAGGIIFHSSVMFILSSFKIYYSKEIFLVLIGCLIVVNLLVKKYRERLIKIKLDFDGLPIYFVLFFVYFLARLIILASTSYVSYYHWDEMRVYQYLSKALFLTHDTSYYFEIFAPINTFVGTMSYEFGGIALSLPRIINVICFAIIPVFMYSFIREHKVNRHIAALFSMLFLISSGEVLYVYKTFYTNIYYTLFILVGVYLFIKHYFLEDKDDIPFLSYYFLIGAFLSRREGFYHIFAFLFLTHLYMLIKRRKFSIKLFLPEICFSIFFFAWTIFEKNFGIASTIVPTGTADSSLMCKLTISNFTNFFRSMLKVCFGTDQFYLNYLIFFVFLISIVVFLYYWFRKSKRDKYFTFFGMSLLVQVIYLAIVLATTFLLFSVAEIRSAASFSRYLMTVIPINFVVLPILIFHDTVFEKKGERSEVIMEKNPKVLLIIPAFNEQDNILNTYNTILSYNKEHKKNYDVIVINDGSSDDTLSVCRNNDIPVINLIQNLGIGGAVQTGYKYAMANGYDIAIQYDGDGQHDVSYVDDLVKELKSCKADIVIGSRFTGKLESFKSTRLRRFGISIISRLIRITTGVKITDPTSGFRAVNKSVIAHFANTYPKEFPEPESIVTLIKRGFVVKEVPVKMKERINGVSSIRMWKSAYYMISVCFAIIITSIKRVGDC